MLARNSLWNLGGNLASILVALLSVPILLKYLGKDRLGVISLVWIVEGQFGIFDLGLSYALTKMVSEKLGLSKENETPTIFWNTLLIMATLGLFGSLVLWISSPWLVHSGLKVPIEIQAETLTSFHLVSISLPIVISTAALRGLLGAHQRFDLLNLTRVPISMFSYLVPLVVLPFSHTLGPFVCVLVVSRFFAWLIYLLLCFRISPVLWLRVTFRDAPLRHMFHFGGWMTITNIVGPIMVSLDRLLIGSLISMAAVAYYATPYEAATRLWIIPSSFTGVLFPALAATLLVDRERASFLYQNVIKYIFIALFPITLTTLTLGHWALEVWLGSDFSEHSTTILQLLTLGVFTNSLAQVPFWQIQASGRPDLAAKAHLIELPLYLLAFWRLTTSYGILGAGIAWLLRTTIDSLIMFWLSGRLLPESRPAHRRFFLVCIAAVPFFLLAMLMTTFIAAVLFTIVMLLLFLLFAWKQMLTRQERIIAGNPLEFLAHRKQRRSEL